MREYASRITGAACIVELRREFRDVGFLSAAAIVIERPSLQASILSGREEGCLARKDLPCNGGKRAALVAAIVIDAPHETEARRYWSG